MTNKEASTNVNIRISLDDLDKIEALSKTFVSDKTAVVKSAIIRLYMLVMENPEHPQSRGEIVSTKLMKPVGNLVDEITLPILIERQRHRAAKKTI